jgi:hypothetical protein
MEEVVLDAARLTWNREARLAHLRFERKIRAVGDDARAMVGAMSGWIGDAAEPFGLLGDGANLAGLDAEYRSVWSRFLRVHRDIAVIAFFNMNPFVRVAADMFRIGTGLRVKAFADEAGARAWLREMGIAA